MNHILPIRVTLPARPGSGALRSGVFRGLTTGLVLLVVLLPGCSQTNGGRQTVYSRPQPAIPAPEPHPEQSAPCTSPMPSDRAVTLGSSVQGRSIAMYTFGEKGETTLIFGGFHGSEPTSTSLACDLIAHLEANPEIYAHRRVHVVPAVNPDGLHHRTRANLRGVDINRNFPAANFPTRPKATFAGGSSPASEPETRAVLEALRLSEPDRIISIHSIARGRHGNNFDGPAQPLAEEMSRHNGYPVLPTMGYPTPGSFGSYAGIDEQIPTITLELPRDADEETCWSENREALLAAISFDATRLTAAGN